MRGLAALASCFAVLVVLAASKAGPLVRRPSGFAASVPPAVSERADPPASAPVGSAPPPAAELDPADAEPGPRLLALAKETFVYAEPRRSAQRLGYLRTGAQVRRAERASGTAGCPGGWYGIVPEGYVCASGSATLDLSHPVATLLRGRADRDAPLPYRYGMTHGAPPVLYARIPPIAAASANGARAWPDAVMDPLPELLARGEAVPTAFGFAREASALVAGRTVGRSAFAFERLFDVQGQRLGLTPDLELVRLDRVDPVEPSAFHGLVLTDAASLPVAFVMTRGATLYSGDPTRSALAAGRALEFREAVPITDREITSGSVRYVETRAGDWIPSAALIRVQRRDPPHGWEDRRWIDVSLRTQTLTAYDGARPVFVTLVSTGVDGGVDVADEPAPDPEGDPENRRATPIGQFLIHTKHVTTTMAGSEVGDEFDLREVPYVQYFHQGFALHAAYWHDGFGRPRSHGCVNLSPRDARFLFHWTDPPVPRGWHGVVSRHGTPIVIHR